jgi:transcriptional regulator GlxA family with amidase domain
MDDTPKCTPILKMEKPILAAGGLHPRALMRPVDRGASTDTIAIPDRDSTRFLRHLRDRYLEPISLEQSALALGVSLRRVQGHFRRHVGRTPIQELNRLRVEHARRLLRDSDLKLEAVAQDCGFANRFHFIRAFRRTTGVIPREYRQDGLRSRD